jgi:hypothetical protein
MQLTRVWPLALVALAAARSARAQRPEDPPAAVSTPEVAASSSPPAPSSPPSPASLDVHASSDLASYADSDHVFVFTPSVAGTIANPTAGWSVTGSYLVDVVSAASVDIVSTASRHWTEVRQAGTLGASFQRGTFGVSLGAAASSEPDYLSLAGGGAITHDFADKNATVLLGFNHEHDVAGRTGTPFSLFSRPLNIESFKAGLTLVLDKRTIASFIGDLMVESGDSSKPYRYIPLFAPGTVVPVGASIDLVTRLRVSARPLEQLPLARDRYAFSFRLAHRFGSWSTLRLDERLYDDSWALKATTTDLRYLVDLGARLELGPHLRVHAQTAVSFWERAYTYGPGFAYPALRTGDRELGPLLGFTGGGSLRWRIGPASHPSAWVLGLDLNVIETRYLDDLYTTDRLSTVGALSLEAER